MKPDVKYPKKSTWGRITDKYYPIIKSIIKKHVGLNWNDCFKIIKKHVPDKYMFVAQGWFPDKVNRNGDLQKGTWGGIIFKERLTRPFVYPIIYIDENNIIRETPKFKSFEPKKQFNLAKKINRIDYWDPQYKIDFEITTSSNLHLSILKYWQSPLLKDNVCLDLENNPVKIKIDNLFYSIDFFPIKKFIEFCEKNKYTYRIVERSTLGGVFSKYHYKPFYNNEYDRTNN